MDFMERCLEIGILRGIFLAMVSHAFPYAISRGLERDSEGKQAKARRNSTLQPHLTIHTSAPSSVVLPVMAQ